VTITVLSLTCGQQTDAGGCYSRPTYNYNRYANYNYNEVLIANAVIVPLYVVGFQPPPAIVPQAVQPQQAAAPDDKDEQIRQMKLEIERLRGGSTQPQMPPAREQASASMTFNKCASCHDSATAKSKGGGNVFFDQGRLIATADQRLDMIDAIIDGRMPRGGKLKDDEGGAVVTELSKKPQRKGGV